MGRGKVFSIRFQQTVFFGLLFLVSIVGISTVFIIRLQNTLRRGANKNLETIAENQALLFEERFIKQQRLYAEIMSRRTVVSDPETSVWDKIQDVQNELSLNTDKGWNRLAIADTNGEGFRTDGTVMHAQKFEWFLASIKGNFHFMAPYLSYKNQKLVCTMGVPIYSSKDKKIIGALAVVYDGLRISRAVADVKFGKTGFAYMLNTDGRTISHQDDTIVKEHTNRYEAAKEKPELKSIGDFEHQAVTEMKTGIGTFTLDNVKKLAAYSKVPSMGWTMISVIDYDEVFGPINALIRNIVIVELAVILAVLLIIFFLSSRLSAPIKEASDAMKNISEGDGDLTSRLHLKGSSEIMQLADYFNKTIEKIQYTILNICENSRQIQEIGSNLSSNMTETATTINQISTNIASVKGQAMTQAASVSETSATMEEIIHTIKNLNGSIEIQARSVASSSSVIEKMVENIVSITKSIEKANEATDSLDIATDEGKAAVGFSNDIVKQILEESGSLIEASNVIQSIASQTNLLAMNAAIEAAHAGESGKGFAVVADEIRKLAEESSVQGKTITSALKRLGSEIVELNAKSAAVSEKFDVIANLSVAVKDSENTLGAAMREQENGSREVLEAIRSINAVTSEVKEGSAEMLRGGEQVAQEMRKLDDLTRIVSERMNEMATGAVQINNAIQEVNEMTRYNKQAVENLNTEVGKFKAE